MSTSRPLAASSGPIVIAHRGASGYLPEHTLAAKAYAHALGADHLEQDVILTRDDVPIVFHDLVLEEVTDVATVFPGRRRADGHWYAIDFDWSELQRLCVHERIDLKSGLPAFPRRFRERLPLRLNSLAEELTLVRGLNAATGRHAGIYTELKSPAWHRAEGKDLSSRVLGVLNEYGYRTPADDVRLLCFDAAECRRLRLELGCTLRLVQLVGENAWRESATDYDTLRSPAGLAAVARYAQGIGPWIPQVVSFTEHGAPLCTTLVADAHAAGLAVYPFTFRVDQLPPQAPDDTALHRALFELAGVDGVFTDFPDRTLALLGRR